MEISVTRILLGFLFMRAELNDITKEGIGKIKVDHSMLRNGDSLSKPHLLKFANGENLRASGYLWTWEVK